MGSIYTRGKALYVSFKEADGKWTTAASGFDVGEEAKAREVLGQIERKIAARLRFNDGGKGPVTLRTYAEKWLAERPAQGVSTAGDEASRIKGYVLPTLGHLPIAELRPHHIRDLVRALKQRNSRLGERLAPPHCSQRLRHAPPHPPRRSGRRADHVEPVRPAARRAAGKDRQGSRLAIWRRVWA